MNYFDWDNEKNEKLKSERGVGFEDVLSAIEAGNLLDILENSNKVKYPNQKVFVVQIEDYVFIVPFVEDEEKVFLKTIIPSRKATKKYLIKKTKI